LGSGVVSMQELVATVAQRGRAVNIEAIRKGAPPPNQTAEIKNFAPRERGDLPVRRPPVKLAKKTVGALWRFSLNALGTDIADERIESFEQSATCA